MTSAKTIFSLFYYFDPIEFIAKTGEEMEHLPTYIDLDNSVLNFIPSNLKSYKLRKKYV